MDSITPVQRPTQSPTHSLPQPESEQAVERPSQESTDAETTPATRLARLNSAEKYWVWKAGLRAVICVLNIVGIGCVGWLMSAAFSLNRLYGYVLFSAWDIGVIVVFCVSLLWCLFAILLPLFLKPTRPLHPGIAVGIDLILWLGFIVIGLFTLAAVFETIYFGQSETIQDPSTSYSRATYSGEYVLAPNNTWIYNITSVGSSGGGYYNYTTGQYEYPPLNTTGVVRDCTPEFTSCAEQDEYINKVWRQLSRTRGTTIVVNAIEWLDLILFFALFVWACVDTHRYNRRGKVSKEQIIADRIIADLESKGLISVRDGVVQPVRTGQPEMVQAESSRANQIPR